MSRRHSPWIAVVVTLTLAGACSRGADQPRDTSAPAAVGGVNANPVDTGMSTATHDTAGKDHGAMTGRSAPKDSNDSLSRMKKAAPK